FGICNMPIGTSSYWNEVHGFTANDVEKDTEGLQTMRNLGRNMAFMIKSINLGKEKFGLPQNEKGAFTSFFD
ncbi:MAG: flavodoxin family protein, partial [Oscillospiraceae bacterium]|nr:flavodoxin family protein [Oscillospiraceae bacterium]